MGAPAITARHRPLLAAAIYRGLVKRALRRQFHRVWLRVDGALPVPGDGPLVVYLNHPSWWDGYAAMLLDREVLGGAYTSFVMVDQEQLRRFRFFRWCGAFSVDRTAPSAALASVDYAARQLQAHREQALWIFPQGELLPNDRRPLTVLPGVARIALASRAQLLPVALRYEFGHQQRPELFIRLGPVHSAVGGRTAAVTADLAARLTWTVEELRDDVVRGDRREYDVLLRGRSGVDQRWNRVRGRAID